MKLANTIFLTLLFSTLFFTTVSSQVVVTEDGLTGIGLLKPARAVDLLGMVRMGSDANELATPQAATFSMRNYKDDRRDFVLINATSDSTENHMNIGGGHSDHLAANHIHFLTATNNTKRKGTIRMAISPEGNVGIGVISSPYKFYVKGTAGKPGGGEWLTYSDMRLKQNIRDYDKALGAIRQIKAYYFNYKPGNDLPTDEVFVGLMAQEYQRISPSAVKSMPIMSENGTESDVLAVDASEIKYMLVGAVQELDDLHQNNSIEIERLKEEMAKMNDENAKVIAELREEINQLKANSHSVNQQEITLNQQFGQAFIEQNKPNPVRTSTQISYFIPDTFENAEIDIFTVQGQLVYNMPIAQSGHGNLTVNKGNVAPGMYIYSLKVDGQLIATHKMMVLNR